MLILKINFKKYFFNIYFLKKYNNQPFTLHTGFLFGGKDFQSFRSSLMCVNSPSHGPFSAFCFLKKKLIVFSYLVGKKREQLYFLDEIPAKPSQESTRTYTSRY